VTVDAVVSDDPHGHLEADRCPPRVQSATLCMPRFDRLAMLGERHLGRLIGPVIHPLVHHGHRRALDKAKREQRSGRATRSWWTTKRAGSQAADNAAILKAAQQPLSSQVHRYECGRQPAGLATRRIRDAHLRALVFLLGAVAEADVVENGAASEVSPFAAPSDFLPKRRISEGRTRSITAAKGPYTRWGAVNST
jgi:hypothetical protein